MSFFTDIARLGVGFIFQLHVENMQGKRREELLSFRPSPQRGKLVASRQKSHPLADMGSIPTLANMPPITSTYSGSSQISATGRACIPCLPKDSIVWTSNGIKLIQNIKTGDRVLGINGDDLVLESMQRPFHGQLISLKVPYQNNPILLTPEHPVLAIEAHSCRDMPAARSLCYPKNNPRCKGCKLKREYSPKWVPAKALSTIGIKGHWQKHILLMPILNSTLDIPDFDITFLRLAGYYLSEGSVTFQKRGALLRFDFNKDETEYANEVALLLRQKGMHPTFPRSKTSLRVQACSKSYGFLFASLFGKGALNKKIPEEILHLPKEKLVALLETYWHGDGSKSREHRDGNSTLFSASTVSADLAVALRLTLHRLGILHGLDRRNGDNSVIEGRAIRSNGYRYVVRVGGPSAIKLANLINEKSYPWRFLQSHLAGIDKNFVYLPIKAIEHVEYRGQVFNLKTMGTNTYNENGIIIHNCGNDHISAATAALTEAIRFAKGHELDDPEIASRITIAMDELNAFERIDGAPEKFVELPEHERDLMTKMLLASRELRHKITDLKNSDDLRSVAAAARQYRIEFMARQLRMQKEHKDER